MATRGNLERVSGDRHEHWEFQTNPDPTRAYPNVDDGWECATLDGEVCTWAPHGGPAAMVRHAEQVHGMVTVRGKCRHPEWRTGHFDRNGIHRFIHLIRGPLDPVATRAKGGPLGWREILKLNFLELRDPILELLADGRARTFNEITVTLWDRTGDVAFDNPPDRALWSLIDDEQVEHTIEAPIYFRRRES
jgi:hypothetical protein